MNLCHNRYGFISCKYAQIQVVVDILPYIQRFFHNDYDINSFH